MKTDVLTKKMEAEIVPDVSAFKDVANIKGKVKDRVMELVDNSIDAKIEGEKLQIDVNAGKKGGKPFIEVNDNGCGMSEWEARGYFRLGGSRKTGKKKIGRFGWGAKIAIMGLGDTCKLYTKAVGENSAVQFDFDVRKLSDWKVEYEILDDQSDDHGTSIRIENLTVRIASIDRFCEKLREEFASTYHQFIETEQVEIRVNGVLVETTAAELLPELYQDFDFQVNGKRVRGWCCALKKAGVNWNFGLNLISNGRVIKHNDFLTRQAHTTLARLCGEVNLDEFETDIHKTDFLRANADFEEMQERLINIELAELISKISKLTNKEVFEKYEADMVGISKTLNRVVRTSGFLNSIDLDDGVFKKMKKKAQDALSRKEKAKDADREDAPSEPLDQSKEEREPRKRAATGLVIHEPIAASLGYDQPVKRWAADETDQAIYLTVEVNLDHPACQNEDAAGIHMKNSILEAVSEFILSEERRQNGYVEDEIQRFNQVKDMLIRHSLAL